MTSDAQESSISLSANRSSPGSFEVGRLPGLIPTVMRRLVHILLRTVWFLIRLPIFLIRGGREMMTPASSTLLVMSIVGLNVIWDYPWIGVFSICVTMLGVGWLANRLFRPQLRVDVRLPVTAAAGEAFAARLIVRNARRIPAMELFVQLRDRRKIGFLTDRPVHFVQFLRAGQRDQLKALMSIDKRGVHACPIVRVESLFPFHLFRSTRTIQPDAQIAITPRPLDPSENAINQDLVDMIAGFTRRQIIGESMEYTGSREYQPGMPVRRWDFASWARLGRPIVREFATPANHSVLLIVDVSLGAVSSSIPRGSRRQRRDANRIRSAHFERVLSAATTAIQNLARSSIRARMVLTSEKTEGKLTGRTQTDLIVDQEGSQIEGTDGLLIRLASASGRSVEVCDRRICEAMESAGSIPVVLITGRHEGLPDPPRDCSLTLIVVPSTDSDDAIMKRTMTRRAPEISRVTKRNAESNSNPAKQGRQRKTVDASGEEA